MEVIQHLHPSFLVLHPVCAIVMAMVMSNQDSRPSSQSSSIKIRRKSSWATTLHPRAALKASRPHPVSSSDIELASLGGAEFGENMEEFMELGLTLNVEGEKTFKRTVECPELSSDHESHDTDDLKSPRAAKPFQKWMMTLQRRGQHRSGFRSSIDDLKSLSETVDDRDMHDFYRRSSSDSSFAFVTGVRSASISIAGSVLTRSRRDTARSSHYARTDRSSRGSISAGRRSEDSVRSERSVIDPAVKERLLQRRRILEELISTEEGYIGDVKFLMNVCSPLHHLMVSFCLTTATGVCYDP